MEPAEDDGQDGARCFLESAPLEQTKLLAAAYECDIAIPNDAGLGNILMYTRIVEDLARSLGRPLRILTGRLNTPLPLFAQEDQYPIWNNNPFVASIVDADSIDRTIMPRINDEMDNLCQFSHMIENIAYHYRLRPRYLSPSLFLSKAEQDWAIEQLRPLSRPVLCIHPHGTSSPKMGNPWYEGNWRRLLAQIDPSVTAVEIFKEGYEQKDLATRKIRTTIREMMSLVWASDLFVGFDSSVAHVATAFRIPAVVLWDPFRKLEIEERWQRGFAPASLSRWSYPQNKNLMLLGDRDDEIINMVADWIKTTARLFRR
jgi:Glycosyltransferase family 9 (heptosyltransferase)